MRTNDTKVFFVGLFMLLLAATGCKKLIDYVIKNPDVTQPGCRITSFSSSSDHLARTGVIYYNKWGNPDSVIYNEVTTGQANYRMIYDDKKRLIECLQFYPSIGVDTCCNGESGCNNNDLIWLQEWSKYSYDNKNRIVADTTYYMPIYKSGHPFPITVCEEDDPGIFPTYAVYSYDQYDRVVKKVETNDNGYENIRVFKYDAKGNLVDPLRKYDDKISLLRTNKIWMFLNLDYSLNNPFAGASYNSNGLPTGFNVNTDPYYFNFLKTDVRKSSFSYACK